MFSHYMKITLRNITRQKGYAFINISGLAIGLVCAILIFIWIRDEISYDRFHSNIDNLYRLEEDQNYSGNIFHVTVTPFPVAPAFKEQVPEIKEASRMAGIGEALIRYHDKSINEKGLAAVDPSYFKMFSFPIISGSLESFAADKFAIFITEDLAQKYFGDENPLGQTLNVNNQYDLKVAGVIKNFPENSTYRLNAVLNFEILKEVGMYNDSWGSNSINTFIELYPGSSVSAVNKKMNEIYREHNESTVTTMVLFPYKDMKLYGHFGYGNPMGFIKYIYIFGAIALFILLIACINFMNLSTARSAKRAKEIGMRKVIGALRGSLIRQFFGESILLSFFALLFSIGIVALLLTPFNDITGKDISLSILFEPDLIFGLLAITLFTGIVSGFYPALFLSSFRPVKVLKGTVNKGSKGVAFRRVLVVLQFSISIFLILGTFVVFKQLDYMKNKELGFNKDQVMYLDLKGNLKEKYDVLKNVFKNVNGVITVTGSRDRPALYGSNSGGIEWDGKEKDNEVLVGFSSIDYGYLDALGIKLKSGRDFSQEFTSDEVSIENETGNFLINEELEKLMGDGSAIGKRIKFMGVEGHVIGVMKNYHYSQLSKKIEPLALTLFKSGISNLILKISSDNISETMDNLKTAWSSVLNNYPFEFKFLDEDFDRMYRSEERMFDILKYFAIMAIIIACLGLFGLASFTAEQRTKEIGIRKVLGASEFNLTFLLCREFALLVLISNLIAWPVSYFMLSGWLEDFAYRISLEWSYFLLAALLVMIIAVLTVSFQAIKAAIANPVRSLRYE